MNCILIDGYFLIRYRLSNSGMFKWIKLLKWFTGIPSKTHLKGSLGLKVWIKFEFSLQS